MCKKQATPLLCFCLLLYDHESLAFSASYIVHNLKHMRAYYGLASGQTHPLLSDIGPPDGEENPWSRLDVSRDPSNICEHMRGRGR